MNLTTRYLGFKLRTPLVPSASPLSEKIEAPIGGGFRHELRDSQRASRTDGGKSKIALLI